MSGCVNDARTQRTKRGNENDNEHDENEGGCSVVDPRIFELMWWGDDPNHHIRYIKVPAGTLPIVTEQMAQFIYSGRIKGFSIDKVAADEIDDDLRKSLVRFEEVFTK